MPPLQKEFDEHLFHDTIIKKMVLVFELYLRLKASPC